MNRNERPGNRRERRASPRRPIAAWASTLSALLGGAVVAACGGNGDTVEVSHGTVIQNATIVDTRDGSLVTGQSIIIDGRTIARITSDPVQATGSAVVIDATAKFVVPGFLDMHTHLLDSPAVEQPLVEQLLIASGITGIREMRGAPDLVQAARTLNTASAAGTVDAPEILLIPGATIGLNAPPAAATSASDAALTVQQEKAYGAQFIKTIGANREATFAFLAEARNQGLTVAGHLNPSVSARESSVAGWKAIEHLGSGMGTLLGCSTQEDSVRAALLVNQGVTPAPNPPSWAANTLNAPLYQRVHDSYDAGRCLALAQTFATNGTWHVPTLIRLRTQRFVDDATYANDPNLIYVSRATRASWQAAATRYLTMPASAVTTLHQYFELEQALPLLLKQGGVRMLAGSDTAVIANWVIPGVSLHQEFGLLAAAGLTPLDVLQMTTLNGAQFLGREATMGTVAEGKNADLVLLDGNPIESVANLDRIATVVLKGKVFSAATLARMKSDVARFYATQTVQSVVPGSGTAHDD